MCWTEITVYLWLYTPSARCQRGFASPSMPRSAKCCFAGVSDVLICTGFTGALATTNGFTAVLVLTLPAPSPVNGTDVSPQQPGAAAATVTNVWPFPNQA